MLSSRFDYIVIGSGSSGGVIAARLSESGKYTVLCLEAGTKDERYIWTRSPLGSAFMIEDPKVNWCDHAEPSPDLGNRRLYVPHGKLLGGSSALNSTICNRGQASDYDAWAQMGCKGWSFQDVLPFFKKLESTDIGSDSYRGREGPIRITSASKLTPFYDHFMASAEATGLAYNPDYLGAAQSGVAMAQLAFDRGRRQSTATCYLAPARRRPNLTILPGSEATSLIIEGKACTGVRYRRHGRMCEARVAREVIVSCGAINTPKLLELSGIGNLEIISRNGIAVAHALAGVGENLRDHFGPILKWTLTKPGISLAPIGHGWRFWRELGRYVLRRQGFMSQGIGMIRVYARSHEGIEDADIQLFANPFWVDMKNGRRQMSPVDGFLIYAQVQRPESSGSVHIRSADPFAAPAIDYRIMTTDTDRRAAIAAVRCARKIVATPPLANVVGEETLPGPGVQSDNEILDFIRATGSTTFHFSGTCRMGVDVMAVVDERLRVHGIDQLRLADASIMPTLVSGNTGIPCIMIGEKCADMVLADATA